MVVEEGEAAVEAAALVEEIDFKFRIHSSDLAIVLLSNYTVVVPILLVASEAFHYNLQKIVLLITYTFLR